jgi:PAS domain S-box-containing protein
VLDAEGSIEKWVGMNMDVDSRKRAEAALKASKEKYRALFESMDEAYAVVEVLKDKEGNWADFRFLDANPAFMIHTNMPYPVGRTATDLLGTPNPRWTELYGQALDTGKPLRVEETEATLGRIFDLNIFALDRGKNRVAVLFTNITERKQAEAALRASEERLRTLMEGVPQLVWRSRHEGHWTWASPQWTEFTGQTSDESCGRGWLDAVHPDDRAGAVAGWAVAGEKGAFAADYRIFDGAAGQYRWFHTRASPVRDADGEIVEWLGTSTDIDELRTLQQRQQLLLAELQHRVRNTLSVIRMVARRTAESSVTVDEMAAHLDGRIEAFARVQAVVTRDPGAGVGLRDLIESEMLAHAVREGERLHIDGPALTLSPRAAETISLAVHELATNAVKHGALASRRGGIDVRWRLDGDSLHFSWKEFGLDHELEPPEQEGFGMELLVESLPYELDAETQLDFQPAGLRFILTAPSKSILAQQVRAS